MRQTVEQGILRGRQMICRHAVCVPLAPFRSLTTLNGH
jgi:hypothetical protein